MIGTSRWRGGARNSIEARVTVTLLVLGVFFMWTPNAWTAPEPKMIVVETAMEAWYHVLADTSAAPAPLPVPLPVTPDPVNPYGENTLHVGITAGKEDSRSYITLDTSKIGLFFEMVDGILELPIDEGAGTREPKAARIQVCLSDKPSIEVEGSFEQPPQVHCDQARSGALYSDNPYPRFLVDLNPFADHLGISGLAIVPWSRAAAEGDTWHVAFYAKRNKTEAAKPIKAEISYLTEEGFSVDPSVVAPPLGSFDFDGGGTANEFGTAPNSQPSTPSSVAPVALVPSETLSLPAYTMVWWIPLVLLAFSIYFGSAFTRDMTRKSVTSAEDPSSRI